MCQVEPKRKNGNWEAWVGRWQLSGWAGGSDVVFDVPVEWVGVVGGGTCLLK